MLLSLLPLLLLLLFRRWLFFLSWLFAVVLNSFVGRAHYYASLTIIVAVLTHTKSNICIRILYILRFRTKNALSVAIHFYSYLTMSPRNQITFMHMREHSSRFSLCVRVCECVDLYMNVGFDDLFLLAGLCTKNISRFWYVHCAHTHTHTHYRRLTDIFNWNWHQWIILIMQFRRLKYLCSVLFSFRNARSRCARMHFAAYIFTKGVYFKCNWIEFIFLRSVCCTSALSFDEERDWYSVF